MLGAERQLVYGPPTEQDIKLVRDNWYSRHTHFKSDPVYAPTYQVMQYDTGTKYGAVVYRYCDKTYWYIRDIFQMYAKWLGPIVPYEVESETREVIVYVRKS